MKKMKADLVLKVKAAHSIVVKHLLTDAIKPDLRSLVLTFLRQLQPFPMWLRLKLFEMPKNNECVLILIALPSAKYLFSYAKQPVFLETISPLQ